MSDQTKAHGSIFKAIGAHADLVAESEMGLASKAAALRDLALAYRYAAGGTQPGSSVVEK